MSFMLCRTRVSEYSVWKDVFDSHELAHRNAGLTLTGLWRCADEPNNVFFMFEVADRAKAEDFIQSPESASAGEVSGVIDGEYNFVESAQGY